MLIVETYLNLSKGKRIGLFSKKLLPINTIWWFRNESFDKIISNNKMKFFKKPTRQFIVEYGFLEITQNWYICIDNARFSNHSDFPNSKNIFNEKGEIISCITTKIIQAGDEILCNYRETCLACSNTLGFIDCDKKL